MQEDTGVGVGGTLQDKIGIFNLKQSKLIHGKSATKHPWDRALHSGN